jgi:16S rRNA G527 N7-methylase RsmG
LNDLKRDTRFFISSDIISKYGIESEVDDFLRTVLERNLKFNLVSRETSPLSLFRIAADCLVPFEFISPPKSAIFDVGPGAGFPSIVIMFAFPDVESVLIERTKKKAVFLESLIRRYDLKANIIGRDFLEVIGSLKTEWFDYGFLKLVRPNERLLKKAFNLIRPGGGMVWYADVRQEAFSLPAPFRFKTFEYYLDDSNQLRTITFFSKGA